MSDKKRVHARTTDSASNTHRRGPDPETTKGPASGIDPSLFTADDASGYYDGMDTGAYAVPFLGILQALSPACQRGTPEAIEGAQPGKLINIVTREIMDDATVSVLRRSHTLCYWNPREKGGGFIREEEATPERMAWFAALPQDDKKRRIILEGTVPVQVTEHRNFWSCLFGKRGLEPAVISMSNSQLSVARSWNTNIDVHSAKVPVQMGDQTAMRPVLHSGRWHLGTVLRKKNENSWYMWTATFVGLHSDKQLVHEVRERVATAKLQQTVSRQLEHKTTGDEESEATDM
jgi:hypothetical protein